MDWALLSWDLRGHMTQATPVAGDGGCPIVGPIKKMTSILLGPRTPGTASVPPGDSLVLVLQACKGVCR